MFAVGTWTELLLIGVAVLVLFKPEDYPAVMRFCVRWYKKLSRGIAAVKAPFEDISWEMDVADFTQKQNEAVLKTDALKAAQAQPHITQPHVTQMHAKQIQDHDQDRQMAADLAAASAAALDQEKSISPAAFSEESPIADKSYPQPATGLKKEMTKRMTTNTSDTSP